MKKFLFVFLLVLPFVFTSCSSDDYEEPDFPDEKEEEPEKEREKPYSGWDYSEGYETWEGWEGVLEMTTEEFLTSTYMDYPETRNYSFSKYFYNRSYCARSQSFTTYTKKKVERYTIYKAAQVDTIPMNELSIARVEYTYSYYYLFDTDIDIKSERTGVFMDDDWFNTINVRAPSSTGLYCYNLSEHGSSAGIESLEYYGKTFYAVEYSEDVLCRIVIVEK